MKIKDKIWILKDDRPGTMSQSLGLAEELGFEYEIIDISYGFFSFLPNNFFQKSLIRLDKKSKEKLQKINYLPSYIICAGRRAASIALFLKEKSKNKSKVIQIMNPNINFDYFDFVILPKHDKISKNIKTKSLVRSVGSLTKTNPKLIKKESEKFAPWFENIKGKKIALMLGGSSKNTTFSSYSAIKLAKQASQIANNMKASLLVLTSPRTGRQMTKIFKNNLDCNYKFFDFLDSKNDNPYLAILGISDFFIVTGDSVSMISECCSTKKPVYIFDDRMLATKKHRRFHRNLFDENYAQKLERNLKKLEDFSPKKLDETRRIAKIISAAK